MGESNKPGMDVPAPTAVNLSCVVLLAVAASLDATDGCGRRHGSNEQCVFPDAQSRFQGVWQ
jgi:hypothetical protein